MKPGDIVIATFSGAQSAKTRPAVVLSTTLYHDHRPDVILGLITSKQIDALCPTDYEIRDWRAAHRNAPSTFRLYVSTRFRRDVHVVGRLVETDWQEIRKSD